jgi:hypothetical protein
MYWACANSSWPLLNSTANGEAAGLPVICEAFTRPKNRGTYTVAGAANSTIRPHTQILALLKKKLLQFLEKWL